MSVNYANVESLNDCVVRSYNIPKVNDRLSALEFIADICQKKNVTVNKVNLSFISNSDDAPKRTLTEIVDKENFIAEYSQQRVSWISSYIEFLGVGAILSVDFVTFNVLVTYHKEVAFKIKEFEQEFLEANEVKK